MYNYVYTTIQTTALAQPSNTKLSRYICSLIWSRHQRLPRSLKNSVPFRHYVLVHATILLRFSRLSILLCVQQYYILIRLHYRQLRLLL
jgi:hypothetical protein